MASNADQTGIGYPASQIDANKTQWKEYLAILAARGLGPQTSMLGAPISAPQSVIANPGQGVSPINAGKPLAVTKNPDGSTASANGQISGTSCVINNPA
jgi:hypothetical protein